MVFILDYLGVLITTYFNLGTAFTHQVFMCVDISEKLRLIFF